MVRTPKYNIDDIEDWVGKEIGVSDWLVIDQARIDTFADATLDPNPLHVDPEAARTGPFGVTIAHGFLTLSLLSHFSYEANLQPAGVDYGINYGFDRVRFMSPVKVGDRIRCRMTLSKAQDKGGGRWVVKSTCTVEIENNPTPALVASWLGMFLKV